MRALRLSLLLILAILICCFNTALCSQTEDSLIIPGKQVGEIHIGDVYHPYESRWGKPDQVNTINENRGIGGYLCSFDRYKMGFFVKKDIIYVIYCANPYYHTKNGIRVGDSAQKIRAEFGNGERMKRSGHTGYILHFPSAGINFVIDQHGNIEQIQIQ